MTASHKKDPLQVLFNQLPGAINMLKKTVVIFIADS